MDIIALVLSILVLALLDCEVHGQCGNWEQQFYTVNEGESTGSVTLTAQFTTTTSQQLLQYATRDDTATGKVFHITSSLYIHRSSSCYWPAMRGVAYVLKICSAYNYTCTELGKQCLSFVFFM